MWCGTDSFGKLLWHMIKRVSNRVYQRIRTGRLWLAGSFMLIACQLTYAQMPGSTRAFGMTPHRCGLVEHERILQQRDPNRLRQVEDLNRKVAQALFQTQNLRQQADQTIYRIPVVVHVIHSNPSGQIGGPNNVNISDEQIRSQIQVLNEDYRRREGTNGFNTNPLGADAMIEFYLATTDPSGQPSNGITRHYYADKASFNVFDDDVLLSQIAYWPSDRYLNVWVTKLDDYLGYTQFPTAADTLGGLPANTNELTDGTIIDYRVFGRRTGTITLPLYLLGRTVTHEIGHWLGLIHTWGDGAGCNEDYVADTPPMQDGSVAPQSCRQTFSNCNGRGQTRDLMENYMNYWPDACMNMFTAGQVARMRTVLTVSPRRARLIRAAGTPLTESETLDVFVYPNPASSDPAVEVRLKGFQSFTVDVFDASGRQTYTMAYFDVPSTRLTIPVFGLPRGVYVVRVKTDSETASKRLLVL